MTTAVKHASAPPQGCCPSWAQSVSPTSHSQSLHVNPPHPLLPVHSPFRASYFQLAGDQTPLQLLPCPPPHPSPPPLPFHHRAIPAHLAEELSANEGGGHGEQAPMGQLFHVYKTFPDTLLGCTFCQSRAPGRRATAQRESERERASVCVRGQRARERESERRGVATSFFFPQIPILRKVVGETEQSDCLKCPVPSRPVWASSASDCDCVSLVFLCPSEFRPPNPKASPFQRGWRTHT